MKRIHHLQKKSVHYWAIGCVAVFICIYGLQANCSDGKGPEPGIKPLDQNRKMQISSADRCPVCGMLVIKHLKFASAIQLKDHTTYYFCGTGCMIRSWLHPEIYLGKSTTDLKTPIVKEYFTGREIDARECTFVIGSNITGPMGSMIVPIGNASSLKAFQEQYGGKDKFLLKDLNDEKWFEITGKTLNIHK